jgi:hypothetical protein
MHGAPTNSGVRNEVDFRFIRTESLSDSLEVTILAMLHIHDLIGFGQSGKFLVARSPQSHRAECLGSIAGRVEESI